MFYIEDLPSHQTPSHVRPVRLAGRSNEVTAARASSDGCPTHRSSYTPPSHGFCQCYHRQNLTLDQLGQEAPRLPQSDCIGVQPIPASTGRCISYGYASPRAEKVTKPRKRSLPTRFVRHTIQRGVDGAENPVSAYDFCVGCHPTVGST